MVTSRILLPISILLETTISISRPLLIACHQLTFIVESGRFRWKPVTMSDPLLASSCSTLIVPWFSSSYAYVKALLPTVFARPLSLVPRKTESGVVKTHCISPNLKIIYCRSILVRRRTARNTKQTQRDSLPLVGKCKEQSSPSG